MEPVEPMSPNMTLEPPQRPTWIEVDRSALWNNLREIRRRIGDGCRLCGVVKANAYGHGAVPVGQELVASGVDYLAVATLGEAFELRDAGIGCPILVLGYTPPRHFEAAVDRDVTLAIYDRDAVSALEQCAAAQGKPARVHVKVNTGMNRLGLRPEDVPAFLRDLQDRSNIVTEGLFTHFATSDTDLEFASVQFQRFRRLLDEVTRAGLRPPICHAANSAATLSMPETHLDMVRCGIALYGLDPDEEKTPLPPSFQPVMGWKAEIVHVTHLAPGEGVSYGLEFVAERPTVVAVIPLGYADGFPRRPLTWGSVLLHGQWAPIAGRVCMDQTVLDVTDIVESGQNVQQGDEAVLIGRQGDQYLSAEEVARRVGTINYDVVSRILARVPRVMVDDDS